MVKAGYKQTEVGEIPEDWDVSKIGDFCPFVTSGSRGWAEYYSEFGDPFIRITNLSRKSIDLELEDLRFVQLPLGSSEGKRTALRNQDILISITADIGICSLVTDSLDKPAYINQHISLVRFDNQHIIPKFVNYFLASDPVQRTFVAGSDTGAKAGMNLEGIRSIFFARPEATEQNAIAEALSDVDGLIGALEKQIAKKWDIKTATMQQLLTGKKRLPGFGEGKGYKQTELGLIPEDWGIFPLNTQADVIDPHPSHRAPPITSGGVPFLGIGDLDENGYIVKRKLRPVAPSILREQRTRYNLDEQHIALGRVASIGKVIRLRNDIGPYALSPTMGVIKPRSIDCNYLIFSLLSSSTREQFDRIMSGSTRSSVGMNVLRNLQLIKPKITEETESIGSILSSMDFELRSIQSKLSKTKAIKQGMMQELLTGRTRLV